METPLISWDWRPKLFRPPFAVRQIARSHFQVTAAGVNRINGRWCVATVGGTQEDAERVRDLAHLRYDAEEGRCEQ